METSASVSTISMQALSEYYETLTRAYDMGGLEAVIRDHGLVLAAAALALLIVVLLLVLLLMPSRRKIVRKRMVRVTRQAVAAQGVPEAASLESSEGEAPAAPPVRDGRWKRWGVPALWGLIVFGAFMATYIVTGSNGYCGQSCHVEDPHVATAVENRHADCVDCHESGPVFGGVARLRMAIAYLRSGETTGSSLPVDPSRCLRCHEDVAEDTVETAAELRVSHKEILGGGRTCGDCHVDVGHREGRSLEGGMARCTACHDGTTADSACETCHVGGSPLARPRTVDSSTSTFVYPKVQVASRDCSRCHGGDRECVDCHNGFVLPHPSEFREGGHGRIAAFDGKERCFKCHSLEWCSSRCHGAFAHDSERWPKEHQTGTSATCGSCHPAWDGTGDWCDVCH